MKITESSEAALREAKEAWAAYNAGLAASDVRRQEFEQREKEANAYLRGRAVMATLAARTARNSVRRLASELFDQVGTVHTYAILAEAEELAGLSAEVATHAAPITRNGSTLTYSPEPADLIHVIEKLGLDPENAPRSAEFTVKDGRVFAVTPSFGPEGMHPVVALVMADGSKHAQALVEFAQ